MRSKTLLELARNRFLPPETLPEPALGVIFALEIASLLGDPAHALEKLREEPIRKYDLSNIVLWIASR